MNFRNKTEEKVVGQLLGTRQWQRLEPSYPFPFLLKKCSSRSYAIHLGNGAHTGTFIGAFFVDPDECKALGWKIEGVIENAVDPDLVSDSIKLKGKRKVKKDKK